MTEHLKQDDFGWFHVVPDKSVPLSRQDRARALAAQSYDEEYAGADADAKAADDALCSDRDDDREYNRFPKG